MKTTIAIVSIFVLACVACGQQKAHRPVSKADLHTFKYYEHKSTMHMKDAPDSAIYFADKALKLAQKVQYAPGEAQMLGRFARINEHYGNLKLAVKYEQQAIAVLTNLHDTLALAEATANLGVLKAKQKDLTEGNRLLQNALAVYKNRQNVPGMIRIYTDLGNINEHVGNSNKALEFYLQAEELTANRPLSKEYFPLLDSIGSAYVNTGNAMKALDYYEKGISKSAVAKNNKQYVAFLRKAARLFDTIGNKQKALEYHQQGLEKAREWGEREEEIRLLIHLAALIKDKDANQGIAHLKNALNISHSIGNKTLSAEIYRSLNVIYKEQENFLDALIALEEHHRLNDSLLNANKGHKITVLQNSYELDESKLHIQSLQLANQKRTSERNALIMAAVGILIISLILSIYFYRTNLLNKKLHASNQIKDTLFSIIGHDLRNPISGISQLLTMMDEGKISVEQYKPMIATMRKQSNVTLEILTALLKWGEAQLKGVKVNPSNFNPADTVVKNLAALQKQSSDKNLVINNLIPADLKINGDVDHFDFIVRNLLSNAIKFSPTGGMIEVMADTSVSDQVIFSVRDEGKGVSKEQQKAFATTNLDVSYGTGGEKGTGIGLMLSKEFVRANNGKIWIESEEGKGAKFLFGFGGK